jgi:hypothetical protein
MNHNDHLVLNPVDLTDKWGFGDGDMMDPVLDDWLGRSAWSDLYDISECYESTYFSSRIILTECVSRYVATTLPEDLRDSVSRVFTVHNPIRVYSQSTSTDATDDEYATNEESLRVRLEKLAPVSVAKELIDALCNELFPLRQRGWMAMYDALYWLAVRNDFLPVPSQPSPFDSWDVYYRLVPYVTKLADEYNDDELLLAAEIVSNTQPDRFSVEDLRKALASSRSVLR